MNDKRDAMLTAAFYDCAMDRRLMMGDRRGRHAIHDYGKRRSGICMSIIVDIVKSGLEFD